MEALRLGFLTVPEYLDGWLYRFCTPKLWGTDIRQLGIRPEMDVTMFAAGGLMGIRTGVSLMIGAVINYCILVPWMIDHGDIQGTVIDGAVTFSFRQITMWALWGGVAMMTTASLFAFFSKPGSSSAPSRGSSAAALRRTTRCGRSSCRCGSSFWEFHSWAG